MREIEFIGQLAKIHGLTPFESDAEVVDASAATHIVVSSDSFSECEDFLSGLEPEAIGRLMATGVCTDILASGALPVALEQVWNLDERHAAEFYLRIARGVEEVLSHYGAHVIGGDVGMAKEWCWTATVFGRTAVPVRRVASRRIDFDLYASGHLGLANASVALGKPLPPVPLRDPVPNAALFATDTSGGFFDALENFRRVNEGLWMEVDVERTLHPLLGKCLPQNVEPGWTLVGGVGEYELVYAVPSGMPVRDALRIGRGGFVASGDGEIRLVTRDGEWVMRTPPPDWRSVPESKRLATVAAYWQNLFAR